ncbi:WhiB family transcriptional regulator [Microbacterium sp. MTN4-26]|uniref:WhiB family transcriptional regulator n=1 Tax=unclassified Microbacterium TaxID=2609290 RepID=UPI0036F3BAB3
MRAWGATETEDELDWQTDALCTQVDPEIFFPNQGEPSTDARRICASCDVAAECLEYALRERIDHGVWGGRTPRERNALKRTTRATEQETA